jgi:hypothetical protein
MVQWNLSKVETEREVDYKKVIVTEVDEDLRFYAQFVDNGMLSFKSFFFVYGQTLFLLSFFM